MEKEEIVETIKEMGFYRVYNPPMPTKFINPIRGEFYKVTNHNKEYYYVRINDAFCIDFDAVNILDDLNQMVEFYLDMHRVAHIKFVDIINSGVTNKNVIIWEIDVKRTYISPMSRTECVEKMENFFKGD